jgi:hypothetical protein
MAKGSAWCAPLIIYVVLESLALVGVLNQSMSNGMKAMGAIVLLKSIPIIFMLYWLCKWGMYKWAWAALLGNFIINIIALYSMVLALLEERRTVHTAPQ